MGFASTSVKFIDIVQESDPDCFLYNYARQGELDFGMWECWPQVQIPEGKTFHCFEEHKRYIDAKFNLLLVQTWEPDAEWSIEDQVASFCAEAMRSLVRKEILWEDWPEVRDRIAALQAQHTSFEDVLAQLFGKKH